MSNARPTPAARIIHIPGSFPASFGRRPRLVQEHDRFREEFEREMQEFERFYEQADEYIQYLLRKAERIEEYLSQR